MVEQVTVREIVDQVIRNLMNIQAPVSMIDTVIIPIRRAVGDLEMVINAWDEDERKKKAAEERPVRLEVVPNEKPQENAGDELTKELQAMVDEAVAMEEAKEEKAHG